MGLTPDAAAAQAAATSSTLSAVTGRPGMGTIEPTESAWSSLWRPFTMTSNQSVAQPSPAGVWGEPPAKAPPVPEAELAGGLLQPFYVTDVPAPSDRRTQSPNSQSPAPEFRPLESSLARQLMLSGDEYLQAAATPAEAPMAADSTTVAAAISDGLWALSAPLTLTNVPPRPVAPSFAAESRDALQASFLQESLPAPNGELRTEDINLPGNDREDSSDRESAEEDDGDGDDKKQEGLVGANQLGDAPEDNSLDFLRTQTVLLKPGDVQFDIGFQYTLQENDFPVLLADSMGNIINVDEVQFRGRELAVPMELRFGVLRRLQAFVQVPVGWANTQASIDGVDIFENDGGIGDIVFGATVQLCDATKDRPYTIGSLTAIAPTGGDPFTGIIGFSPSAPSLGNGFWSIGGNLLWIETRYDPVIVFYGLGTRYQFEHRYVGIEFQPGPEYNYTFGYGFAVNERVTLSTQFFGAYVEELKANGNRVEGTNREPMSVQLAATFLNRCDRIVEPFVTFGLTDDAISSNVGITWTY